MTDTEFGRLWAAQQGYAPNAPTEECPYWFWNPGDAPDLPWQLYDALPRMSKSATDCEAFAALGATVRTLQSLVPPLTPAVTRPQIAAEIRGLAATQQWGPEKVGTWAAACETIARLVEEGGSRE